MPASDRFVIVNADDLGLPAEVDHGLFEAHDAGIVTSASLLVDGPEEAAIQQQIDRQLAAFIRLVGSPPDHIDSHHHMHRLFNVARLFLAAGRRDNVAVRGFSDVVFVGRFYGQPVFGKTDVSKISVEVPVAMLRAVKPGVTEISCHDHARMTREAR